MRGSPLSLLELAQHLGLQVRHLVGVSLALREGGTQFLEFVLLLAHPLYSLRSLVQIPAGAIQDLLHAVCIQARCLHVRHQLPRYAALRLHAHSGAQAGDLVAQLRVGLQARLLIQLLLHVGRIRLQHRHVRLQFHGHLCVGFPTHDVCQVLEVLARASQSRFVGLFVEDLLHSVGLVLRRLSLGPELLELAEVRPGLHSCGEAIEANLGLLE
mmetsp:Transcript_5786/g.12659  ORF Transcript_5786/g.12659 Transcript_5786/m.12659 type:complete len:213 (-) Transcript_5786:639-1277(-)